jgi:predicted transcriptional regulator
MVGLAVERMAFDSMDPLSGYGDGTVQAQLDQLAQRRESLKELVKQSVPFQQQMTSEDWLNYNERTRSFGEENAIGWLLNKYSPK